MSTSTMIPAATSIPTRPDDPDHQPPAAAARTAFFPSNKGPDQGAVTLPTAPTALVLPSPDTTKTRSGDDDSTRLHGAFIAPPIRPPRA
jgi:hypothetical protein